MKPSRRMLRRACLVGSVLVSVAACGSLTGLNDLEADPSFQGSGASGGSGGSGGGDCVKVDEVDKVGVMLLVEGGITQGLRDELLFELGQPNQALTELYIGFDFFPEPGPATCGAALDPFRPVFPPNRHSDPQFLSDVQAFFDLLEFVPEGPDAPEQGLRYSGQEFQRTPSFEASGIVVVTEAEEFGCDPGWDLSADTARDLLAKAPFTRTYVVTLDGSSTHTENLALAGGTFHFDGLPAADIQLALETIGDELKECTFWVPDSPDPSLWFDGEQLPRMDPEDCATSGADGYYPLGKDKVGLCAATCIELVQKKLMNDPDGVVNQCPN